MKLSDLDPSQIEPVSPPPPEQQQQTAPGPAPASAPLTLSSLDPSDINPIAGNVSELKYSGVGQQALSGIEGAAKGLAGPIATGTEKLLSEAGVPGLTPEDQEGRAQAFPWTHGASEVAGFVGPAVLSGGISAAARAGIEAPEAISAAAKALDAYGQAGVLSKIGKAVPEAAEGAGLAARAGAGALRGALETAAYQTGDEVSKRINDPNLSWDSALPYIGLSGAIGAVGGGFLGAISPMWAKENAAPIEQAITDLKNTTTGDVIDQAAQQPVKDIQDSGLSKFVGRQKSNAAEIIDIGMRNDLPVMEGMTSDAKLIQKGEDALLNGPPTLASVSRQKAYQEAFDKAGDLVDRATAPPAQIQSETEAGNALKASIGQKLESENAPIKAMYDALGENQAQIGINEAETKSVARQLKTTLESTVPGTERYNFVKSFMDRLPAIDDLEKLKQFRTELWRSAGPYSKDLAHDISSVLDGMEERSIKSYASTQADPTVLNGIIEQADTAKSLYKVFKEKLNTLGKALGKSKVYGPQDFIDFVQNINPQTLSKRLFNERNTEFAQWFSREFPDEFQTMRDYQRGLIRTNSTKEGVFQPKAALKAILDPKHGMEPEMQKLLFSPEELQKMNEMKTYLDSFPKSFNPSGTDHTNAFRAFFEHPTGAAIANIRDFGIQSFVRAFGRAAPGAEKEAGRLLPILANSVGPKEANAGAFKHATEMAMAVVRGEDMMKKAVRELVTSSAPVASNLYASEDDIDKLDNKLKSFQTSDSGLGNIGGQLGHYLPNHDIAMKAGAIRSIQYLNSIRPKPQKVAPLDPDIEPSDADKQRFRSALAVAAKPLSLVAHASAGTLTSQMMSDANAMMPGFVQRLGQKLVSETMNLGKDHTNIPYTTKMGISTLVGQPMDSSLKPISIATNQSAFSSAQAQQPVKAKPSMVGMREMKSSDRLSLSSERNGE